MKIIGYTVGTTLPKPNLAQTDPQKGDYVKGKEVLDEKYIKIDEQELTDEQKARARDNIGAADAKITGDTIAELIDSTTANYNESIIGLSIDGKTITYIKGDGSVHTFETQDTDTTYSLATDETTGLVKLYATTGSAEDGTMTQKAIQTELEKKVSVSINASNAELVFTTK